MAGKDDSNIFDFYSNLIHQEPEDGLGSFGVDHGFAEWNSFDRFCKSLVHSVFQNLGPAAKEEFLMKINNCMTHEEIVNLADNETVINITIDMLLQEASDRNIEVKDAFEAKRFREEGNGLFKRKDYLKSLNLYSKAISLAPDDHVEFVLSLANRSATFIHLNQFDDSLKDIDLVIEKGTYPEDRLYIVFGRKIQCLKALNRQDDAVAFFNEAVKVISSLVQDASQMEMNKDVLKTSLEKNTSSVSKNGEESKTSRRKVKTELEESDVHPLIPALNKKLSVNFNEVKGRHVVCKSEVSSSEVLLHEEPYSFWLKPSANEDFCSHCLKSLTNKHFIPCPSCSVRFCSKECFDEGQDKYHWLECKFMDVLSIVSSGHLAIRIILREGIEKSLEMFLDWVEKEKRRSMSPGADYIQEEEVSKKRYDSDYHAVLDLVDNLSQRTAEDKTAFAVASLFTAKLVNQILNFDTNPLAALIFRHVMQISCNVIGIEFDPNDPESLGCQSLNSTSSVIAIGVYPTVALLNHACDRSTYRIFTGKSLTLKAYDSIKCGSEVTFNYGPFDRKMSRKDRREVLKKNYFFDCDCNSCNNHAENIGSSFACPVCPEGAVVVNFSDRSSYCVKCLKSNILDVDAVEEKVEQLRPQMQMLWDELDQMGNVTEAEYALNSLIKNYSKYVYSKSYRMIELKERLAYVYELQKKMREAMKLWLECYYSTRVLEGEDNYDCLFFLLKITQGLIVESDECVESKEFDKIKSNLEKINKYFKRAVMVSKKLKGREGKLLEAREEILHTLPDLHSISNDIKNLMTLCNML